MYDYSNDGEKDIKLKLKTQTLNSETYVFADDTNLLNINSNLRQLQKQVNTDLKICVYGYLQIKYLQIRQKLNLYLSKSQTQEFLSTI